MQINNQPQISATPAFKQVNLVKVSKTFFNKEASALGKDTFMKGFLSYVANDKMGLGLKLLLSMIGLRKKAVKFFSFLEFPGYASVMQKAEDLGTSFSWFKQNSGVDFREPLDEEYDSFWVLTKEDKDAYIKATPKSEMKKMMSGILSTVGEKKQNGEALPDTFVVAQTAKWLSDKFDEVIKGKEVKEIIVDDDYPLENLKGDLNI